MGGSTLSLPPAHAPPHQPHRVEFAVQERSERPLLAHAHAVGAGLDVLREEVHPPIILLAQRGAVRAVDEE